MVVGYNIMKFNLFTKQEKDKIIDDYTYVINEKNYENITRSKLISATNGMYLGGDNIKKSNKELYIDIIESRRSIPNCP